MSTNSKESSTGEIALREMSAESLEEISGKKADSNTNGPGSIPEATFAHKNNLDENSSPKKDDLSHHKRSKDGTIPKENRNSGRGNQNLRTFGSTSSKEEDMGSQWIFLDSVPDFMMCKICSDVFESPQLLSCCGTNICKKCMDRHLQRIAMLADQQPSCPFCRSTEFELLSNTALEHSINQLRVQCCYQHKGCGWIGALQNGNLHLKECDFVPIDCPNRCGCEQFERCKFSDHMLICPHTCTTCSFGTIGCDVKMPLLRPAAQKHARDCLSEHLLLVARKNTELLKDFRHICTPLWLEDCLGVANDEYVKSQREALASTKHTIKTLKESLQETQKKTASLKAELRREEICLAEIKQRVSQTKNAEAAYKEIIAQIQTLPVPEATGLSYPPITFTIDNFKKRIKLNHDNIMWVSPPFYTHVGGYKMCLSMHPDGNKSRSTHKPRSISVKIHFLAGKFDEHLMWPFPGAIFTITAINQRANKFNRSANLELDGKDTIYIRSRQINDTLGFGFGVPDFLLHSDLSGFLSRDNCFKLMVYRIQFLP